MTHKEAVKLLTDAGFENSGQSDYYYKHTGANLHVFLWKSTLPCIRRAEVKRVLRTLTLKALAGKLP